jgi:hypothetical protein
VLLFVNVQTSVSPTSMWTPDRDVPEPVATTWPFSTQTIELE